MKFLSKSFLILFFIVILNNAYCSAEMKGLSEKQLKGFVGEEKVCLERTVYGCDKSKEMKLAMGVSKLNINQLNELSIDIPDSISNTVYTPTGGDYQTVLPTISKLSQPQPVDISITTVSQPITSDLAIISYEPQQILTQIVTATALNPTMSYQADEFIRISKPVNYSTSSLTSTGMNVQPANYDEP